MIYSYNYDVIMKNDRCSTCDLPLEKKTKGMKRVYKLKCSLDDSIECYKGRLVPKGYAQEKR